MSRPMALADGKPGTYFRLRLRCGGYGAFQEAPTLAIWMLCVELPTEAIVGLRAERTSGLYCVALDAVRLIGTCATATG